MDFNATLKSKKAGILTFEADIDIKLPSYLKNANTGLYQANITILDPAELQKTNGAIYTACLTTYPSTRATRRKS